jgi:hypothetical protein
MPVIYTQRPPCPFTAQTQSTASKMHTAIIVSKQGPCLDCWHNTLPWAYIWWLKPGGSMKRQMISSCEFHCQLLLAVLVSIDGWYLNSSWQNLAMKYCVQVNMLRSRSKFLRQSSIDPVHLAPTNCTYQQSGKNKRKNTSLASLSTHRADWLGLC